MLVKRFPDKLEGLSLMPKLGCGIAYLFVTSALARLGLGEEVAKQRQANLWGSLGNQPRQIRKSQVPVKECLKKPR